MICSAANRRQKCATRARWEASKEMRWHAWHGYLFPVSCGEHEKPTDAIVWDFCPACGGLLPLGLGPVLAMIKRAELFLPPTRPWQADGEGEE